LNDVPSIAATSTCLRKQISDAGNSMWNPIAIDLFPHLATVFSIFPDPKPAYKTLLWRFLEADRATTVSDDPSDREELATVSFDDYLFHYDIFIDGVIQVSWAGKVMSQDCPIEDLHVTLPLSVESARLIHTVHEDTGGYRDDQDLEDLDYLRLRVTITDIKSFKTAKIFSETQAVSHINGNRSFEFQNYPIAHQLCVHEGYLLASLRRTLFIRVSHKLYVFLGGTMAK
jgi:hypothetical protein